VSRTNGTALVLSLFALGCWSGGRDGAAPVTGADQPPPAEAREPKMPYVRVAELEIRPADLDAYTAAVREEMEASVRDEPGVLAIYCVAEKDDPAKLRFFEMYADEAAYQAHIGSAHFRKYVVATKDMISSRRLLDAVPVQLSAKPK
jgi:quinol monooxygenase YgiN